MTQLLYIKVKKYLEANNKTASEFEEGNIEIVIDNESNELDYNSIRKWDVSGLAKPTEEQLNSYESVATTEEKNLAVIGNRQSEYPNVVDCIHALLDGGDTLTQLQAKRQEIKNKYPKE